MTIFKNVHCAECVQSLSSLSCHIHEPNINPSHSFVLLFNFTERSVRYVFKSWFIWGENALPQVLGICTQWQMYDPFQGTCRDLICPVGMTIQSGQCVQSLHNRIADYSSDTTIGDCFLRFLSSEGIENYTNYNSTTLVKIFQQNITNNPTTSQQIYVRAEFSVAKRIEDALHRFVHDEELNDNTSRLCNVTTLLLVASSQSNKNVSQHPICEGFTLHDVQLVDIDLNNNSGILYRTEDGHVYTGLEFMHATVYEFSGNARSRNISRETYLTLCDPFVGKSCPVLSFNTSEFLVEASGKDVVFVHKASGVAFPADDIWQLPDGSLRVCNFLHRVKQDNYPAWVTALSGFSFAGSIISVVCLLFALLTYSLFPSLRNQPGKIIMNLMVAFVLAQFVLMVGKISTVWLCVLRATVLHFIWLVVFSWMSVLAVELTRSFKSTMLPNKETDSVDCKVLKLGILAWGLPAIFVSVCFLVSKLGQNQSWQWLEYGGSSCWIVKPLHSFFVFGIPVAIFLLINFVMVTFMIFKVIANRRRLAAVQMTRKLKTDIMLCLKIIVLTGVTWSLFYAASVVDSVPFWYITVWINSLQGAFVSLMFILRDNVRALWLKKLVKVWGYCQCHHNGK
ncbi:uncharacterized protein LOC110977716 [Acanthaster planci]|uniref:Uncharacterized protein LOC110977716 n=1 Tax=Acanthaster planci TaxID=133434 RepID=A0A8B7Y5Y2_ACAPL|nr:uncharacterized protein LOC110977716 [Acanthaster planci]